MGEKVGNVPKDMASELEENYSERRYPYVVREDEGEFAVFVHSKPFGGAKLSDAERKKREKEAKEKKESSHKRRLESAKAKLENIQAKVDALEEE